jgi:hypothetical protein
MHRDTHISEWIFTLIEPEEVYWFSEFLCIVIAKDFILVKINFLTRQLFKNSQQ